MLVFLVLLFWVMSPGYAISDLSDLAVDYLPDGGVEAEEIVDERLIVDLVIVEQHSAIAAEVGFVITLVDDMVIVDAIILDVLVIGVAIVIAITGIEFKNRYALTVEVDINDDILTDGF